MENKHRRPSKILGIISTVVYLLLLPVLIGMAFCSFMVFDKPNLSTLFGLPIIFIFFCLPISIFPTIYYIWSNHSQKKYKRVYFFCAFPLIVFGVAMLAIVGLSTMNDFFFPLEKL